jgi:hypothetical protein
MVITLGVRDCQYRDVQGGIVELVDDQTGNILTSGSGAADIHMAYFSTDSLPNAACTHTVATKSLWSALNVPTDRPLTARTKGRMCDTDATGNPCPLVPLGERHIPAIPDTIVIVRPYRLSKP